jgi:hypothetical protein
MGVVRLKSARKGRCGTGSTTEETQLKAGMERGADGNEEEELRSLAEEKGEPPFGIEETNVEVNLGRSFPWAS